MTLPWKLFWAHKSKAHSGELYCRISWHILSPYWQINKGHHSGSLKVMFCILLCKLLRNSFFCLGMRLVQPPKGYQQAVSLSDRVSWKLRLLSFNLYFKVLVCRWGKPKSLPEPVPLCWRYFLDAAVLDWYLCLLPAFREDHFLLTLKPVSFYLPEGRV